MSLYLLRDGDGLMRLVTGREQKLFQQLQGYNRNCRALRYWLEQLDQRRPLTQLAHQEYTRLSDNLIEQEDKRAEVLQRLYPEIGDHMPPGRVHVLG